MKQGNPFVPQAIHNLKAGPRPSIAPLLGMVDTEDPAFQLIAAELKQMADAGVELDATAISIAVKMGQQKHSYEARKRHAVPVRQSIVYYIRRGDLIKIGTTVNPAKRFDSLMPDEILAHEPGGSKLETIRHNQFNPERVAKRGEYFRRSPRLLKHVGSVRELHGPPHPSWPSVATLRSGYLRTKVEVELPEPTTDAVATATEGAQMLSLHPSTISQWARRGRITPAGRNSKGRPVYYVEHMQILMQRNRDWLNRDPKEGQS